MVLAAMSLDRECPAAVLSDRALRLPTFSHLLTVKKRPPPPSHPRPPSCPSLTQGQAESGVMVLVA